LVHTSIEKFKNLMIFKIFQRKKIKRKSLKELKKVSILNEKYAKIRVNADKKTNFRGGILGMLLLLIFELLNQEPYQIKKLQFTESKSSWQYMIRLRFSYRCVLFRLLLSRSLKKTY